MYVSNRKTGEVYTQYIKKRKTYIFGYNLYNFNVNHLKFSGIKDRNVSYNQTKIYNFSNPSMLCFSVSIKSSHKQKVYLVMKGHFYSFKQTLFS